MVISYTNFGNFRDDDWEDEPRNRSRQPSPTSPQAPAPQRPKSTPGQAAATARVLHGSSFVSMELDGGLLPVRFEFTTNWQYHVSSHEVGRELLKAYHAAMVRRLIGNGATNDGRPGSSYPHNHLISERERTALLLETETWDEYSQLQDELFGFGRYRVHGQVMFNDEPVVSVTGNREFIDSIHVWGHWSGCADPYAIEGEIISCVNKIRAAQPKITARRDWSRFTDEQLVELKDEHRRILIESIRH